MTERSSTHVVVSETATTGAAIAFGGFAVFCLFVYNGAACAIMTGFCTAWCLYAAVASDFIADRSRSELRVRRQLGPRSVTKTYRADTIDAVYVRHTNKGNGLALRFQSGRTKGLTMSLDLKARLAGAAAALTISCTLLAVAVTGSATRRSRSQRCIDFHPGLQS